MDSINIKGEVIHTITISNTNIDNMRAEQNCPNPCCFFCTMKNPNSAVRRAGIESCFLEMACREDQEHVLVLSGIWNIAMTQPDDPEFPSLGVFSCMASLIQKGISDKSWLLKDQNIYIPYYAAHIIGSYTMNKVEFAEKAVESGVLPPLLELLRGKISWVEQRVAARALGHLASYENTFEVVAVYEEELVTLAMQLASTCLETVYASFIGAEDAMKRLKYHSDLLTRGVGDVDMENKKAEEWGSQLQCWSLHLLNCFACKERSLNLICRQDFLKELCEMWGGLVNHTSPAGIGLVRILCYSQYGRKCIAESEEVIKSICNLSRSSDDWQYIGIDCLLLLLKDQETRYKVMEIATLFLADLVELRSLDGRSNVGETILKTLLSDYKPSKKLKLRSKKAQEVLQELQELRVWRRRREKMLSEEKIEEIRVLAGLVKQQGNHMVWLGNVQEALLKYSEALDLCPLKLRKERMILYSNRAQCHLLLRDPDAAISDSTRALCLSNPANSHIKSLWRRSQAFDMKGLAKESLMDCIMFLNGSCLKAENACKGVEMKIPYYAARMISKQMDATWIFARAKSKVLSSSTEHLNGERYEEMMKILMERKGFVSGLSTIVEEPPFTEKEGGRRKLERARRMKKGAAMALSM